MDGEAPSEVADWVIDWVIDWLIDWLTAEGLEKFAALFEQHELSVAKLSELREHHLLDLDLPLGAWLRLLKAVRTNPLDCAHPGALASGCGHAPRADRWLLGHGQQHPVAREKPIKSLTLFASKACGHHNSVRMIFALRWGQRHLWCFAFGPSSLRGRALRFHGCPRAANRIQRRR
jgi:hypothetical protein